MRAADWQARLVGVDRELALIESSHVRDEVWRGALAACTRWRHVRLTLLFIAILVADAQIARRQSWSFRSLQPDYNVVLILQGLCLLVPVLIGGFLLRIMRCEVQRAVREAVRRNG